MMLRSLALAAAAVSLAVPAVAHHSFSDYDDKKRMTLTGTLTKVRFSNPHIGLEVAVPTRGGKTETWEFSGPSPSDWRSGGWVKSDFVVGQKVSITGFPKRDGSKHLSINLLQTQNGKKWGKIYK